MALAVFMTSKLRDDEFYEVIRKTSSNHGLESAGLKTLEELLFKRLGIEMIVMRALF